MRWFKMWSEARTDNKLRSLDDAQHRTWFHLLCMANDEDTRGLIPAQKPKLLALEVSGGDVALLERTLATLVDLDMIERLEDGAIFFLKFKQRQDAKPSDEPEATRERQQRKRERDRVTGRDSTPPSRHEKEKREEGDQTRPEGGIARTRATTAAPVGPVGAARVEDDPPSRGPKSGGHLLNMRLGPAAGAPETWPFTPDDLAAMLPAADYFGVPDAKDLPQRILVALGKKFPAAGDTWLAMPPAMVAAWCAEVAKKTREQKGANQPVDPGLCTYAAAIIGARIEAKRDLLVQAEPAAVAPSRRHGGERRSTQQRNMDVLRNAVAKRQASEMAVGQ